MDIDLPEYPVHQGHIAAKQLESARGRVTSQMAALDDELFVLSDMFQAAFEVADRKANTQERIFALAKSKRPQR
jgi:hypothetical protein